MTTSAVYSTCLKPETVRTIDHATIGVAYLGVGTSIEHQARIILIQNFTNANLMFSFDGVNDHFPLLESSHIILDIAGNRTTDSGFYLEAGQRLYVREIDNPTSGSVYFTVFYGRE